MPALGARADVAFGPAGLGDMFVTATSPHGRNRRMGEMLGGGLSLEEALDEMVMVAEGVRAARMFGTRSTDIGLKTPFIEVVNNLLDGKINAEECCRQIAILA